MMLIFTASIASCSSWNGGASSKQVRCAKPKKTSTKKFASKKKKNVPRPPVSASRPPAKKPAPEAAAPPPAQQPDLSIAESKSTSFEEPKDKVIEFKGQKIDLDKDDFSYNEKIRFVSKTDVFEDQAKARDQLKDLASLLKKNPDVKVTIIGNAADPSKRSEITYGKSAAALNQITDLNRKEMTIGDAMKAKAKRVFDLLRDRGVPASQMQITSGTFYDSIDGRVVSFVLKGK